MPKRRALKAKHEQAVLDGFKKHLERCGHKVSVISQPDPPDAIIEVDGQRTWLEITDAWLDREFARRITTSASDDIPTFKGSSHRYGDFVERFEQEVLRVVQQKLNKKSLSTHAQINGPGTLLVGIFDAFSCASDLAVRKQKEINDLMLRGSITRIFDNVFLYDGLGSRQFHHVYPAN